MSEECFRYIPIERLKAWEEKGWRAVSPYLEFQHLAHLEGFAGKDGIVHVVIIEWHGAKGDPIVEPEPPLDKLIKVTS